MFTPDDIDDINLLSTFLAHDQGPPPATATSASTLPGDVYIIAGSAILDLVTAAFAHLSRLQDRATVVLAGGRGHSTALLYAAVAAHPIYHALHLAGSEPEARVMERILLNYFPALAAKVHSGEVVLLVDDKSTNCGENVQFARRLVDEHGVNARRWVVVQDATMSLRTCAALRRCFDLQPPAEPPEIRAWPTFVPLLDRTDGDGGDALVWAPSTREAIERGTGQAFSAERLWAADRFVGLLLGEIPRLRDDGAGYGPRGKGFISHVDIPPDVERAYGRLRERFADR